MTTDAKVDATTRDILKRIDPTVSDSTIVTAMKGASVHKVNGRYVGFIRSYNLTKQTSTITIVPFDALRRLAAEVNALIETDDTLKGL